MAVAVWAVGVAQAGGSRHGHSDRLPQGSEPVRLDPADFSTRIDNPYWPMRPGTTWIYRETNPAGGDKRVVVTVTRKTKRIANGIRARVVRDVVTEGGTPIEITDDYYAQDDDGNIWYLGEYTTEYVDGKPDNHEGSFEAGVDGAQPGIAMPGRAASRVDYRQEYYAGQAEDKAAVLSLGEQVEVPAGPLPGRSVLMTKDLNPLEPSKLEHKFYARGVGPVLTLDISGGDGREELVSVALRRAVAA